LTRKEDFSPWWQHNGTMCTVQPRQKEHAGHVLAAQESATTTAINSMQAAGAAARSAMKLPQPIFITTIKTFARTEKVS